MNAVLFRIVPVLLVALPLAGTPSFSGTCGADPWRCRDGVERIEAAWRLGMASASTPGEREACVRLRDEGLAFLVERSYEATVAWLAARDDLVAALQEDQAKWRALVDAASAGGESFERRAALFKARLAALDAITGIPYPEENSGAGIRNQ